MEDIAESDGQKYHPTSVLNLCGDALEISEVHDEEVEYGDDDDEDDSSSDDDVPHSKHKPKHTRPRTLRTEHEACAEDETLDDVINHVELERSESFVLTSVPMKQLEERLLKMTWLTRMTFHGNGLETLPESIGFLVNLETLGVTSNKLVELPGAIGNLKSLTRLDLNHNSITGLPKELANLTNLKACNLDFNKLHEFPDPLFKMPALETLGVVENCGLRTFAGLEKFGVFEKIAVAIDNLPDLCDEWRQRKDPLPNVTIEWHKVFPDKITDFLFIGSLRTAQEQRVYDELAISRVLTCGTGMSITLGEGMDQLLLPLADTVDANLSGHLTKGIDYIVDARTKGEKVLVHCFAGLSRSASLCCAFLMKDNNWTFAKSLEFVRLGRPNAHPNDGFVIQLKRFQKELGIEE